MKRIRTLLGTALALLLGVAAAQAQPMSSTFTPVYSWSVDNTLVTSTAGNMSLNLTPQGAAFFSADGTNFVAANVDANIPSGTPINTTEFFNSTVTLTLQLFDNSGTTPVSTSQPFTVDVGGSLTHGDGADVSNITITPVSPATATLPLNGNDYFVTFFTPVPPGAPGVIPGSIGGRIDVKLGQGGGPVNDAPEPSTMLLAGLGMLGLGARAWRKRFARKAS